MSLILELVTNIVSFFRAPASRRLPLQKPQPRNRRARISARMVTWVQPPTICMAHFPSHALTCTTTQKGWYQGTYNDLDAAHYTSMAYYPSLALAREGLCSSKCRQQKAGISNRRLVSEHAWRLECSPYTVYGTPPTKA